MILQLLLCLLVALSIHRLWFFEDIFAPLRNRVGRWSWKGKKALLCEPCFAFWALVLSTCSVASLQALGLSGLLLPVAAYWPMRMLLPLQGASATAEEATPKTVQEIAPREESKRGEGNCPPCVAFQKLKNLSQNKTPFVIVTTFHSLEPSYSLVGVVLDQARAASLAGYAVALVVLERGHYHMLPKDIEEDPNVVLMPILPSISYEKLLEDQAPVLKGHFSRIMRRFPEGILVAHDLLFQESFITYARAFHMLKHVPGWQIYHTAHSAPNASEKVDVVNQWRRTLPAGQKLISLAYSHSEGFLKHYNASPGDVHVLPNPRDITTQLEMSPLVRETIHSLELMDADIVQVYPYSGTRSYAKGVDKILRLFSELGKKKDVKVLLVDAHATDERAVRDRNRLEGLAKDLGIHDRVFWMSDRLQGLSQYNGISSNEVSQLMQAANLFAFPTISEACPLGLLEASHAGCLMLLNSDVPALLDIVPADECLSAQFGTSPNSHPNYPSVAEAVIQALEGSAANRSKRRCLRNHSLPAYAKALKSLEKGELSYQRGWEEAS